MQLQTLDGKTFEITTDLSELEKRLLDLVKDFHQKNGVSPNTEFLLNIAKKILKSSRKEVQAVLTNMEIFKIAWHDEINKEKEAVIQKTATKINRILIAIGIPPIQSVAGTWPD